MIVDIAQVVSGLSFRLYMSASDDVQNVTWVNVSNHILNVRRLCAGTL